MISRRQSLIFLLAITACGPSDRPREEHAGDAPAAVVAARDSAVAAPDAVVPLTAVATAQPDAAVAVSALDSGLVVSPDGSIVAFVRKIAGREVKIGVNEFAAEELWVAKRDGSAARRLLESREARDLEQALGGFRQLTFSNDGQRIFFLSPAWETSDALHVVDVTLGHERFVAPANSLDILRSGYRAGCLVVSQHRYYAGGGSYDNYYLFAENGDEIAVVSHDDPEHLKTKLAELTQVGRDGQSNRSCASKESLRDGRR